ncbi:MAG: hypothetical protein GY764_11430 [Halieaceae bacterium]|nr:hypothetical protein [Halieaceae bacterium]
MPTGPLWTLILTGRWALSHPDHVRHTTTASVVVGMEARVALLVLPALLTVHAKPLLAVGGAALAHAVKLSRPVTHLAVVVVGVVVVDLDVVGGDVVGGDVVGGDVLASDVLEGGVVGGGVVVGVVGVAVKGGAAPTRGVMETAVFRGGASVHRCRVHLSNRWWLAQRQSG